MAIESYGANRTFIDLRSILPASVIVDKTTFKILLSYIYRWKTARPQAISESSIPCHQSTDDVNSGSMQGTLDGRYARDVHVLASARNHDA